MNKLLFLLILSGCMVKDGKYIDDNPVEEIAEAVLDAKTGLDLDFTPASKEGANQCLCPTNSKESK